MQRRSAQAIGYTVCFLFCVGLGSSVLVGCADAAPDSSDSTAAESDDRIEASAETRDAIGVDEWHSVESGVSGYDEGGREIVAFRHMTAQDAADSATVSVMLQESGQLSRYQFTVQRQDDGSLRAGDLRRDEPNPTGARRTWTLLLADIAQAAQKRELRSSSIRPRNNLQLIKTGGGNCTIGTHSGWSSHEGVAQVLVRHEDGSWTKLECK